MTRDPYLFEPAAAKNIALRDLLQSLKNGSTQKT